MFIIKGILLFGVFCTSTAIGVIISQKYNKRVAMLKNIKEALNIFEIKINFSFETIPDIFQEIYQKIGGQAGKIFKDTAEYINNNEMLAGDAWELSVNSNTGVLNEEDLQVIKTLGKLLGKTDIEGQVNQIKLVKEFIDTQLDQATVDRNKNEKMYKKLGAIIGLMLVIVLA